MSLSSAFPLRSAGRIPEAKISFRVHPADQVVCVSKRSLQFCHRIDGLAISMHLQVEVRSRGATSRTYRRNDISVGHLVPLLDLELVTVSIEASGAVPMVENHDVTVAAPLT